VTQAGRYANPQRAAKPLWGEGAVQRHFIPDYARMVAQKKRKESGRVAGRDSFNAGNGGGGTVLAGVLTTPGSARDVPAFNRRGTSA